MLALGLAALACLNAGVSIVMLAVPSELIYGEAILYDHARRLVSGVPLYQSIDHLPYTVASYTPLFYGLVAGLQVLVGPGFAPGRALALAALVASAVLVGCLAGQHGHGWRTGLLGVLLFIGLGIPGSGPLPWTALYKEDSLALVCALGAIVVLTTKPPTDRWLVTAGCLAALAILTKQTYTPLALAGVPWLWRASRRRSLVYLAAVVVPTAVVCLEFQLASGVFADNVVFANINPIDSGWLVSNLGLLVLFQLGPSVAAGLYWPQRDRSRAPTDSLLAWCWLGSAVPLLALSKVGGGSNHWMSFAAIGAVFAARAVWPRLAGRSTLWAVLALGMGLLLVGPVAFRTSLEGLRSTQDQFAQRNQFVQLVERVKQAPGIVLAEPLDTVVLADHELVFEPLLFVIFYQVGRWDAAPVVAQVCDGHVGTLVLQHPLADTNWPPPVVAALRSTMQLEATYADRQVYVRRADARCDQA